MDDTTAHETQRGDEAPDAPTPDPQTAAFHRALELLTRHGFEVERTPGYVRRKGARWNVVKALVWCVEMEGRRSAEPAASGPAETPPDVPIPDATL